MDSCLFYTIAFYGVWDNQLLLTVTLTQYVFKTAWEALSTPLTYAVVNFLKRAEREDYYDTDTNFTPFSLQA